MKLPGQELSGEAPGADVPRLTCGPTQARGGPKDITGIPDMITKTKRPLTLDELINETMALADQVTNLDELIRTTPEGQPSEVMTISVDLNRYILETYNLHNQNTRPGKIKRFAQCHMDGDWKLTGDTVKFGLNCELLDGQNRLRGALQADAPLRTYVVFGVDPDAFRVLDTGTVRTGGDTFQVAGVPSADLAGKATRWLMIFGTEDVNRGIVIPNSDLFEHYQKRVNKDLLQQSIAQARKISRAIPPGTLAAMLYLFERKDAKLARIFAHDLEKETRGGRTLMTRLRNLRRDNGGRLNEKYATAFTVMMWNGYRQGALPRGNQLKWTDAAPHPVIE